MIADHTYGIDLERGLVPRGIFGDAETYRLEQERIFGRCWLLLGHDTQIPNPGDYFTTRMGETPVIVCRDTNGTISGLINSCRHRGNAVTRNDAGNARTFTCPYHGWCYDLQGKRVDPGSLVGLPGHDTYYDGALDLTQWGLVHVPRIDAYRGLIFGSLDPEAVSLEEYLGEMRWGIDLIFDRADLAVIPGVPRWRIPCNWKLPSDNAAGDNAHVEITHRAALMSYNKILGVPAPLTGAKQPGFTILSSYGHSMNCQTGRATRGGVVDTEGFKRLVAAGEWWRGNPATVERVGPVNAKVFRYNGNLFPNLFFIDRHFFLRNPLGPGKTDLRAIAFYDRNAPPEIQTVERRGAWSKLGPAGVIEQDDAENWEQSTLGASIAQLESNDFNYSMGIGTGTFVDDGTTPPRIDSMINEHGPLWFYRTWADAMKAESWDDYRTHHPRPVGRV